MSSATNGTHVPTVIIKPEALARKRKETKGGKKKTAADKAWEQKKASQRAYYHANKERILAAMRARSAAKKGGMSSKAKGSRAVHSGAGNPKDALIYLHKAEDCLDSRDFEGTELYIKLCMRVLKGKE